MKVFSYCIYDYGLKYYLGLIENIKIINKYYPDYYIYIYYGTNFLINLIEKIMVTFKNIKVFPTNQNGSINMLLRYNPILDNDVEITIVRDADSEVNERDRWCIDDFLNTKNQFHYNTIRDNYWHKSKLSGGMTMLCKNNINYQKLRDKYIQIINLDDIKKNFGYGSDENVLNEYLYPIVKDNLLVYTNIKHGNIKSYYSNRRCNSNH